MVRGHHHDEFLNSVGAQIIIGDIRNESALDVACNGVAGIFHLASIVQKAGIPDSEFYDVHVKATKSLLDAALKHNVGKIVHCSTIGVLGHIENPPADETAPYNVEDIYQTTKPEGEKVALNHHREHDAAVTVVRPAAVYGPGDTRLLKLFKMVAEGKFRMVGDGNTLIHPVYVDDLVNGMLLAFEKPESAGEVYILGGEKPVTLNEWVAIIAKAAGVSGPGFSIPYLPVKIAAILCETICKPLGIEPPLFRRRVDFFVKNRAFSIDKAKRDLGYDPSVDLVDGANRTIGWYKENDWIV
jgi:nucleoside-diphosphate-sugar epimerase